MMRYGLAAACVAVLLLSACSGSAPVREPGTSRTPVPTRTPIIRSPGGRPDPAPASPSQDGPPNPGEVPEDLASVPDAVPKDEPKSPYGNPDSYEVLGKRYAVLENAHGFRERGLASWYGKKFHGKRTSSGEPFNMFAMTAAHKTLPIPAYARVTNITNGKSVIVKINDRGPFHSDRIIDLSYAAAVKLDMLGSGSTQVDLEVLDPGSTIGASPPLAIPDAPSPTEFVAATPPPAAQQQPPEPAPTSALAAATSGGRSTARYLQAGVFHDPVNAATFREYLNNSGIGPVLLKSENRNERWVYRVLIGPFIDVVQLNLVRARMNATQNPTVPVLE